MKAFDNSSGKWRVLVPGIAASLLVSLSAHLLKWQNPAAVCGDLLQPLVAKCGQHTQTFSAQTYILRGYAAPLESSQRSNMQSP